MAAHEMARGWLLSVAIGILGFYITYIGITIIFPGPSPEKYIEQAEGEIDKAQAGEAYQSVVEQRAQILYQQAWSNAQQMQFIVSVLCALVWLLIGLLMSATIVSVGCLLAGILLIPYSMLLGIGLNPVYNLLAAAILLAVIVAAVMRRKA